MNAFHTSSRYIFDWLSQKSNVKEESLTDWLLYNISNRTSRVIYKDFKRNEEATVGADWEWWILTDMAAYRFLVQAKKLTDKGDNYSRVAYSNVHGLQIDLLIDEASRRGAIPFYAFYSCTKPDLVMQKEQVEYIRPALLDWCKPCINGCFLSLANVIKDDLFSNPKRKIAANYIINSSFGISILDCLLCEEICRNNKGSMDNDDLDQLNNFYKSVYSTSKEQNISAKYTYNEIPQYVRVLIEKLQADALDWFEEEFYQDISNLSGVALFDLTRPCRAARQRL